MSKAITRVLIANRGEIASRIQRTAQSMGMSTVAVYAEADRLSPFVTQADQRIALRGVTARETYLDIDKVLNAAKYTGADAVHPGYGFLSENAQFATAVIDSGLIWIGPSPAAIAAMGDKLAAKRVLSDAGVALLPSIELPAQGGDGVDASAIGYPVLVKAAAGGGGKGMRVVHRPEDLSQAIAAARREAASAFGDDTVFLERWVERARHIEMQIIADNHGNMVHCFERECSIQRRHQKIIEEAPSPAVNDELRQRMGDAAIAVARSIDYTSTGTVEFLVEGDQFWFLEMNTRLQVEHPVTEAITGLDLVREQLLIAQGEVLGFDQTSLSFSGHAIEARLYAEDPANDFLPATGEVLAWDTPDSSDLRFDAGIESGSVIGIEFDPLLAKVISHAPSRKEAAAKLARGLEKTRLQGLGNNRDFLVTVLRTQAFLAGDTTTDFIERVRPQTSKQLRATVVENACIAAAMVAQIRTREVASVLGSIPSGWRNSPMPPQQRCFLQDGERIEVSYRCRRDGGFDCHIGDRSVVVQILRLRDDNLRIEIDDHQIQASVSYKAGVWLVHLADTSFELTEAPRFPLANLEGHQGGLNAPMPGRVVSVEVSPGDAVEAGQLLLILEAMKMEQRILAPGAGTVTELHVAAGQQVANGELLVVVGEIVRSNSSVDGNKT